MKLSTLLGLAGGLAAIVSMALPSRVHAQAPRDSTARDSLGRADLEPITVSAARSDAPRRTLPFAVATLDEIELERGRPTLGLDEALVTIPGLVVANRYNYTQDLRIAIRGFGARAAFGVRGVKILLDGIPQTTPDGQGQLDNVDVSELERVEILRGPSSSLHGNAAGGVISLGSRTSFPSEVAPAARITFGAYDMWKWTASADAPVGPGAIRVAASRTALDGYREHARAALWHVQLRAVQPLSGRTQLKVLAYLADRPLSENPGALTADQLAMSSRLADPRNVAAGADETTTQLQGGVTLSHALARGGSVDAVVYGGRRDVKSTLTFAIIDLDRSNHGTRTSVRFPTFGSTVPVVITTGIDAQWQRDDRRNFSPDGAALQLDQFERVVELGPFLQARFAPHERVTVTGGVRYDRVAFDVDDHFTSDGDASGDEVMGAVSWSGGIAVEVHDAFVPYASIATSFETPTTTELVNRPEGGGGLNPTIDPQHATNVEVGVRGRVTSALDYSLAAFHADVDDELIPFEVPSEPGRRFFRNAGSSRHRGLELGLTARPHRGFVVLGAYTFANYEFTDFRTEDGVFDGNEIPGVPAHQLHWSLRYAAPFGLWGAVDNTHTSSLFVDDANSAKNAGWWTTDLRVGWDAGAGRWRFAPFLGLLNVLDERYAGSVVVNAAGGRYFEPAPGRNAYFGLRVGSGK